MMMIQEVKFQGSIKALKKMNNSISSSKIKVPAWSV